MVPARAKRRKWLVSWGHRTWHRDAGSATTSGGSENGWGAQAAPIRGTRAFAGRSAKLWSQSSKSVRSTQVPADGIG